jgi:hypothetical protein
MAGRPARGRVVQSRWNRPHGQNPDGDTPECGDGVGGPAKKKATPAGVAMDSDGLKSLRPVGRRLLTAYGVAGAIWMLS